MSILSRKAYHAIHDLIVTGEMPAGTAVSEATLARRLRVSRTPVREAIRQLTQEGLLEQIPRRGTIIRNIGRREFEELYNIREALESYAAGCAAGRITEQQLAQLSLLVEEMGRMSEAAARSETRQLSQDGLRQELAIDKAFHLLILEASGNQRMIEMLRVIRTRSDPSRLRLSAQPLRLIEQAHAFHKRILGALRARDAAKASEAMGEHIRCGLQHGLGHFDQLHLHPGKTSDAVLDGLPGGLRKKLKALNNAG